MKTLLNISELVLELNLSFHKSLFPKYIFSKPIQS
nr:MAG TPA: hypothetical protein [Bacteriophage sp.]